jgi:RHS repeat-associated protein
VTVEHRPGLQVQETQYDPVGLELAGLAAPSPGIRGLNNYRFNGKEFQTDLGLNWNHQDWRFLDPTILRWSGVDPELENGQETWTPYSFSYDNAVRYADSDGREPGDPPGKNMMGHLIYGTAVSLVNMNGQMWAGILGSKTRIGADFEYDNEGFIVGYDIHKGVPIGTDAQELTSFGLNAGNVLLSLVGLRAGGGAFLEQAGSKAAVAEGIEEVRLASSLPVIKQGTKEWRQAVSEMQNVGKTNKMTETATDAKKLLKEAHGEMNRYRQYADDRNITYRKGYEVHNMHKTRPKSIQRELSVGNDRQHLNWKNGKSKGHIFYEKPN